MTTSEAQANLDTISSIMTVFGSPARVLFDFGSSKPFISTSLALHTDRGIVMLKHKIIVVTSLGE